MGKQRKESRRSGRKKKQLIIQARRGTIYQTAFIYYCYANGQMQNICSDIFAACKRLCAHKFSLSDAFVYTPRTHTRTQTPNNVEQLGAKEFPP